MQTAEPQPANSNVNVSFSSSSSLELSSTSTSAAPVDNNQSRTSAMSSSLSPSTPSSSSSSYFLIDSLHLLDSLGSPVPSLLPLSLLPSIIQTLCYAVNIESQAAWFVFRTILTNEGTQVSFFSFFVLFGESLCARTHAYFTQLLLHTAGN